MPSNIVEQVMAFVEEECKKPSSKYGLDPFEFHFRPVHDYGVMLAKKHNADIEIVELAAWLHDIGSIIIGREDHHLTGAEIAEKKLKELGYPAERIASVKHCILAHRGSKSIPRETIEAKIIADADSMSHFDNVAGLFKAAFVFENKSQQEAQIDVLRKLSRSFEKLSPESKEIMLPKFEAAKLIFG